MNKQEQGGPEKQAAASGEQQQVRKAEHSTVGAMLRQLRQEKGITIRDAAKETNISASNLVAIEHENYTDLPANTFIRGQVAIYAKLLGTDGAEAAAKFIAERERYQQLNEQKSGKICSISAKKLAEPAHLSALSLIFLIFLLIGLFLTGFCLYTGWNPFSFFLHREQAPAAQLSPAPELDAAIPPAETRAHSAAAHQAQFQPATAAGQTGPSGN